MNKLETSYLAIIVAFILFLLSGFSDFVETLCMVGFFGNGFLYTYTLDYLPKNPTALRSPSVFLYRRQRLNIFGYLNSVVFIGMTLVFFILQSLIQIDTGILIFICWALMVLLFKIVDKYSERNVGDEEFIFEYLFDNKSEHAEMLAFLSRNLPNYPMNKMEGQYFDNVAQILLNSGFDRSDIALLVDDLSNLYNSIHNYNSDEIRAIDKNL